jgi:cytochrome c peroxidase
MVQAPPIFVDVPMVRLQAARSCLFVSVIVVAVVGCDPPASAVSEVVDPHPPVVAHGAIEPLPAVPALDPARVALGRSLFFDKRLSGDGTLACASCHDLDHGGVDGRRFAIGINGQVGTINTPTVWNATFNFAQFWDGRAATLDAQARQPVENPKEMGARWPDVIARLGGDAATAAAFAAAYGDRGVSVDTVVDAIATFEQTLVTPDGPFDRWLRGEAGLDADAKAGFALFTSLGCVACHQGRGVGGNMYQNFGVMGDYFKDRGNIVESDMGRYNVTHLESDRHVFKVPSLRNVAQTAPYFHDGSAATLDDAIRTMARYQLGRRLDDDAVQKLKAFLGSLSSPPPSQGVSQ